MEIEYAPEPQLEMSCLDALYSDVGWGAYTQNLEQLRQAIENSLFVLTARSNGRLVGLVRVVGDDRTIAYVQDLLVAVDFQRKGIGKNLMQRTLSRFSHVRQFVLMTMDEPQTRLFYESLDMQSCDQGKLVSFVLTQPQA